MEQSRAKSGMSLVGQILLAFVIIAGLSGVSYYVYENNFKITCSDKVVPKSTTTTEDSTQNQGQTYTIDGRDGVTSVCSKPNGEVESETVKVEKVDAKIVKGTRQPAPIAPTYSPAPAASTYTPNFRTAPTYTPPKTTYCTDTFNGVNCTTY